MEYHKHVHKTIFLTPLNGSTNNGTMNQQVCKSEWRAKTLVLVYKEWRVIPNKVHSNFQQFSSPHVDAYTDWLKLSGSIVCYANIFCLDFGWLQWKNRKVSYPLDFACVRNRQEMSFKRRHPALLQVGLMWLVQLTLTFLSEANDKRTS